jgi:hypothetical protein
VFHLTIVGTHALVRLTSSRIVHGRSECHVFKRRAIRYRAHQSCTPALREVWTTGGSEYDAQFAPGRLQSHHCECRTLTSLTSSFQNTIHPLSKTSSNVMEGSILMKRGNSSKSARQQYYDTRIYGRTSNSRQKMKRSDNIVKSILPMLGRTKHLEHLRLAEYELEKDQRTRKRRKDHCLVMRSRKQRRLNAQLVRQGYRKYGGEHQEVYLEMPCARTAGESSGLSSC